jgi:hypothetical protein
VGVRKGTVGVWKGTVDGCFGTVGGGASGDQVVAVAGVGDHHVAGGVTDGEGRP